MCWKDMFFSWCVGVVSWCRFNCFFFQTNASYMPKPKDKLVPLITVTNATATGNSIFSEVFCRKRNESKDLNKFISRQMRLENFHCFLVNVSHIPWINALSRTWSDLKNQGVFYRRDFNFYKMHNLSLCVCKVPFNCNNYYRFLFPCLSLLLFFFDPTKPMCNDPCLFRIQKKFVMTWSTPWDCVQNMTNRKPVFTSTVPWDSLKKRLICL